MDQKALLDYFKSIADRQGKYHDHKEVAAWACLVLHFAMCATLLRAESKSVPSTMQMVLLVAVVVVTLLSFLYIRKQLEFKDIAGSQAGAATYFMSEMATSPNGNLVRPLATVIRSDDQDMQWGHVMPVDFVNLAKELNKKGRGAQQETRLYMYGLLFTATSVVIFSILM